MKVLLGVMKLHIIQCIYDFSYLELTPNGSVIGLDGLTCYVEGSVSNTEFIRKEHLPCIAPDWTNMKTVMCSHLLVTAVLLIIFQEQARGCRSVWRKSFAFCQSVVLSTIVFPAYYRNKNTLLPEVIFNLSTIIQLATVYYLQGIILISHNNQYKTISQIFIILS